MAKQNFWFLLLFASKLVFARDVEVNLRIHSEVAEDSVFVFKLPDGSRAEFSAAQVGDISQTYYVPVQTENLDFAWQVLSSQHLKNHVRNEDLDEFFQTTLDRTLDGSSRPSFTQIETAQVLAPGRRVDLNCRYFQREKGSVYRISLIKHFECRVEVSLEPIDPREDTLDQMAAACQIHPELVSVFQKQLSPKQNKVFRRKLLPIRTLQIAFAATEQEAASILKKSRPGTVVFSLDVGLKQVLAERLNVFSSLDFGGNRLENLFGLFGKNSWAVFQKTPSPSQQINSFVYLPDAWEKVKSNWILFAFNREDAFRKLKESAPGSLVLWPSNRYSGKFGLSWKNYDGTDPFGTDLETAESLWEAKLISLEATQFFSSKTLKSSL